MVARVLIVSEVFGRAKPMESLLVQASFEVAIATSLEDSLAVARMGQADVLLLDATVSGSKALAVCREFKAEPAAAGVGVLVLTDEDEPAQRLAALDAGADECLCKPYTGHSLVMRVRSVAQLASLLAESRRMTALQRQPARTRSELSGPARILIVDPDERSRERLRTLLGPEYEVRATPLVSQALVEVANGPPDLALVSLDWPEGEGYRVSQQIRHADRDKAMRLLAISDHSDIQTAALVESGIDDALVRPIDRCEALARIRLALRKQDLGASVAEAGERIGRPVSRLVLPEYRLPPPDRFAA
jgi:DNA-binding response OmpR family regulator